jgi:hypothetical protein
MELGSMARFNRREVSPVMVETARKELFFKQVSGKKYGFGPGQMVELLKERADWIDVPRMYGLAFARRVGATVEDKTIAGVDSPFTFTGALREEQPALTADFLGKIAQGFNQYGGLFSAPCGTGKTIMAIYMLSKIGKPALILVHNIALVKQWREAFLGGKDRQPFTDLKPQDVGAIQQDTCDWYGRKVVIAMVESLVKREYDPGMYKHFGVIVADEVHRHAAAEWHKALIQFPARLRIGLSATPRRKDGLWDVIRHNAGEILTRGKGGGKAKVFMIQTGVRISEANYGGKLTFLIGILANHDDRNELIANEINKALQSGRRVLVLSHRREHLNNLYRMSETRWRGAPGLKIGWYVGGITEEQIDYAKTCNLLFGTYQYAKEALDDPSMDTLFLATPIGDIEQPAGRILRACAGKKEPLVVDFVDGETDLCKHFGASRAHQYEGLGFPVTEVPLTHTAPKDSP